MPYLRCRARPVRRVRVCVRACVRVRAYMCARTRVHVRRTREGLIVANLLRESVSVRCV